MAENIEAAQLKQEEDEGETSLMDLLIVLAKHKKLILGAPLLAGLLALVVSYRLPNIYTAETQILPPQQQQSAAAAMLGQLGGLAGGAGAAFGLKNPSQVYIGMLNSRTVADAIIARFKLMDVYETQLASAARSGLMAATKIELGKDGILDIRVDDKDPKRAADIANAYADELYKLTQTLAVTEASQRRLFFEKQVKIAKDDLTNAEVALKQTEQTTGLLAIGEQSKALIGAVGQIHAQIAAKEVQLASMRTFATEQNPDYVLVQRELAGLRGQLDKYEKGGESGLLPAGKLPEASLEYARRLRDVKYYETLFELLAKQYELARVDEARDSSIIQVLDKAIPPDHKSRPKRVSIVIMTFLGTAFLAILWAFIKEASARAKEDPVQAERLTLLRKYLRWG